MATIHYKKVITQLIYYLEEVSHNDGTYNELIKELYFVENLYRDDRINQSDQNVTDLYEKTYSQSKSFRGYEYLYTESYRKDDDIRELLLQNNRNNLYKLLSSFNKNINKEYATILASITDKLMNDDRQFKVKKMVFLSYAYDDKFYTIALFNYFLSQGIYLFVDWMNNNKMQNGFRIKKYLEPKITQSSALLFMRSMHSELRIPGGQSIRQWCSWEIGVFYEHSMKMHGRACNMYYTNYLMTDIQKNIFCDDLIFINSTKFLIN